MSIVILGLTACPVCQKVIEEDQEYYGFPAFVANMLDPLYFFNDAAFHHRCLEGHQLGPTAKQYADRCVEAHHHRRCIVSGERILDEQNHVFIGYLSSNSESFLNRLNFTHIDRRNLPLWSIRVAVLKALTELKDSGNWRELAAGHYLENLLRALSLLQDRNSS